MGFAKVIEVCRGSKMDNIYIEPAIQCSLIKRSNGTYIDIANSNSAGHFCGICEGGGKEWW